MLEETIEKSSKLSSLNQSSLSKDFFEIRPKMQVEEGSDEEGEVSAVKRANPYDISLKELTTLLEQKESSA